MEFTKMQGIGNDYVYVDCFREKVEHPGQCQNMSATAILASVPMD